MEPHIALFTSAEGGVSYKATIYSGPFWPAVIKRLSREQWRPHRGWPDKPRQLYYIDFSIIQPALPANNARFIYVYYSGHFVRRLDLLTPLPINGSTFMDR